MRNLERGVVLWLGKMAKSLFYFIFILFYFIFLFGLTTQGKSVEKYHMTMLHVTVMPECHKVMPHDDVIW